MSAAPLARRSGRSYRPSPIKRARRSRRTKAEILALKESIYATVEEFKPMTVRQVFYQLVSKGLIVKTEDEYKNVVGRLLVEMRRDGQIPFRWITDHTRWMRKPRTHSSLSQMLQLEKMFYRRDLWDNQNAYVEIWIEKVALVGAVDPVTEEFDVPLMAISGYPSLTFLAEVAEELGGLEKPAFLYYFGDHDPSGKDIPRHVEERLRELTDTEFHFEIMAILPEQIEEYGLPTSPPKDTDSRAKSFVGDTVQLDALPVDALRQLVRDCIERHINRRALKQTLLVEQAERETLEQVVRNLEPN